MFKAKENFPTLDSLQVIYNVLNKIEAKQGHKHRIRQANGSLVFLGELGGQVLGLGIGGSLAYQALSQTKRPNLDLKTVSRLLNNPAEFVDENLDFITNVGWALTGVIVGNKLGRLAGKKAAQKASLQYTKKHLLKEAQKSQQALVELLVQAQNRDELEALSNQLDSLLALLKEDLA
ncbi:hypothetical protein SAMN05216431_1188 [Ligilactobacillus sp. WC1T17]|uniref:Uncharacterized protein n=1 Tax=Ligilactobacillus ruminis TaxID=1623 RepID=A0ABY1AEH7_9LACO|nr:hypothetical protein SAMN05216431_1188 [Ligilactobacillus ruminis]